MGTWSHTAAAHWRCALNEPQQRVLTALHARALHAPPSRSVHELALTTAELAQVTGLSFIEVEAALQGIGGRRPQPGLLDLDWARRMSPGVMRVERPTDDEQRFLVRALQATHETVLPDLRAEPRATVDPDDEVDAVLDAFESNAPASMAVRFRRLDPEHQLRVVQLAIGHLGPHSRAPTCTRRLGG